MWNRDYKHTSSVKKLSCWTIHIQAKEEITFTSWYLLYLLFFHWILPNDLDFYSSAHSTDPVLAAASPPGHQPLLQRGQGQGEGRRSGCRGRGEAGRGGGRGRRVHLAGQSGSAGGSLQVLPGAVAGGLSVPAAHLPDLRLSLLLHQHLPAQHPAGERWEVEASVCCKNIMTTFSFLQLENIRFLIRFFLFFNFPC